MPGFFLTRFPPNPLLQRPSHFQEDPFYEHLPAKEAFELAQRFEFCYTPKSASWLNMIEIEFSALVKQCLDRRIPTKEKLRKEVLAIVKDRNNKQIKTHWQFSIQ